MHKKVLTVAMVLVAVGAPAFAQDVAEQSASDRPQSSLSEARSRIDGVIAGSVAMSEAMERLSADEQRQFLADVNKAVEEMPASLEEKTAKFLNLNHAALKSARKGNTVALLAEVFATVPPESLTVLNERFAKDLFNRASNPAVTYTDEQYVGICTNAMAKIVARAAETDNGSARSAFAILMFVRASNGTPEDLADRLADQLPSAEARGLAKGEWIPEALGKDGREPNYESLLASADAGRRPDRDFVLVIAGPQFLDAILSDLGGKNTDPKAGSRARTPMLDAFMSQHRHDVPILGDDLFSADLPVPHGSVPPHPGPYPWQSTLREGLMHP